MSDEERTEIASFGAPNRWGPYQLIAPLAEGGMATVYIARRLGARAPCVLKRLHLDMETHEEAKKRFLREARIASVLDHPNIARIVDAGQEQELNYIAMEFIQGQNLLELLTRLRDAGRWLTQKQAVTIGLELLCGLSYAHARKDMDGAPLNIVHRDISKRNVLLSYKGEVKIIDFGMGRISAAERLTAADAVLGTPSYMSPEQARSEAIDHRSDLYSVSVLLYELISGKQVIHTPRAIEALAAVLNYTPPPLYNIDPEISVELSAVIDKGMRKAPDARWSTAEEFHEALSDAAPSVDEDEALSELMTALFGPERRQCERLLTFVDQLARQERIPSHQASATRVEPVKPFEPMDDWEVTENTEVPEPPLDMDGAVTIDAPVPRITRVEHQRSRWSLWVPLVVVLISALLTYLHITTGV